MPRSLQPDRQLFGTTLALCLIGAVMVFSASAVTAREEYGNGYTFLIRQLLWVAIGLGRNVQADEHGLPQPAPAARDFHGPFSDAHAANRRISFWTVRTPRIAGRALVRLVFSRRSLRSSW